MAATDPTSFTSSAEIFAANRTLPQIRSIHTALHAEVEDRARRLRTQVGGSYRDLLGTAETIVQMRANNDEVQELLGHMGWRCGRMVVSTKTESLAKFTSKQPKNDVTEAGRQKLLHASLLVVSRLLKGRGELDNSTSTGDRLVLAAKVWVLSRLLVNSLGNEPSDDEFNQDVAAHRKTMESLRRRLRLAIEKTMEKVSEDPDTEDDREDVLKALSAHSLASSSGQKDTLRHFLEVRLKAIALALDAGEDERVRSANEVIQSLRLYTRTLLDVQAFVPVKLSQALNTLKRCPLLEDPTLKKLEGLRLDVYGRWCSEEIQYYTPFIQHDDLDGQQAREIFSSWAEKGSELLLGGLTKTLDQMGDFKSIMELRTSILQIWIREGARLRGLDPQEMQDSLREAINARMVTVLETKVAKLHIVGSEVKATLESWQEGVTGKVPGLWEEDGYSEALESGAVPFIQEVATRFLGRSDAVSKAVNCYTSWFQIIGDVKEVVEELRKQRWDNDYHEIEDEETIERRQQSLSKDDPKMLQDNLNSGLDKSFKLLEDELHELWQSRCESKNSGSIAIYLIRILRELREHLPERETIKKFCLDMVPSLHRTIMLSTSTSPIQSFIEEGLSQRIVIMQPLWEGEPSLPTQPSPEIFQFLSNLCQALADAGIDLWTPAAIRGLKRHVSKLLCEAWSKELESLVVAEPTTPLKENEETEGDKEENTEEEKKPAQTGDENDEKDDKEENNETNIQSEGQDEVETETTGPVSLTHEQICDLCTQWLFDISYLQCCIGSASGEADSLGKLEQAVYERSGIEEKSHQRITRAAKASWSRTSLLFGFLE